MFAGCNLLFSSKNTWFFIKALNNSIIAEL